MRPSSTRRSRRPTSRRAFRPTIFAAALVAAALAGFVAEADQTAPELDGLFTALKASTDPHEAVGIEIRVWNLWLDHPESEVQALMQRGIGSMNARDFTLALEVFDSLVERDPHFAEAWNKRATVHYLLGNDEASVADIIETLRLEPRHFGALSGLALIYERNGQPAAAAGALRRALAVHPQMGGGERRLKLLEELVGPSI